jgi:hypothetical protein
MGDPPSSERAAAARRDNDRGPIRDDIGVDGRREHQKICECECQGRSVGASMLFVQGPHLHLSLTITWLL